MSWYTSFRTALAAVEFAEVADTRSPEHTLQVEARVTSVLPEHRQARASDDEGFEYALTSRTAGIDVLQLERGQRLHCTVEADLRRVLHAEVIA